MSDDDLDDDDAPFEEAASTLGAGLKTCRAVIDNYRAMLRGQNPEERDPAEAAEHDPPTSEAPHS